MRRFLALWLGLALAASVVLVSSTARTAHACSCVSPTDQQAFDESDGVFVGRVTKVTISNDGPIIGSLDPAIWEFDVSKVFKGKVAKDQEVVSARDGASCGLELTEGSEYIVFGWLDTAIFPPDAQPAPGQLSAALCNGTRSTEDGALDVQRARARPPRAKPADNVVVSGLASIDAARLGDEANQVVLEFVGAPRVPKSDACWEGYRARVHEDPTGVVVTIRRLRNAEPPDEPIACTDIGALRTMRLTLREPLGDRSVIDGVTGTYFGGEPDTH